MVKRSADDLDERIALLEEEAKRDEQKIAEKERAEATKKAAVEAAEKKKKAMEEEKVRDAKRRKIAELEEEALQRKARLMGLSLADKVKWKGTYYQYEVTYKVDRTLLDPVLKGTAGEDFMDIMDSGLKHIRNGEYKDTHAKIEQENIPLFSIAYKMRDGTLVFRFTYEAYIPDYDDDYPGEDYDDQSDYEPERMFAYFDVDMHGEVVDMDTPTGCYVKALYHLEKDGWTSIFSK